MNQFVYFILGIILGLAIAIYYISNREEKIEKMIEKDKEVYSTQKLDSAMENAVNRIKQRITELERNLTEEEKDEIIAQCCKEKFYL